MNILETIHLVKRYAEHTALQDVSIAVPEGQIYGLLGPNGAGKTSLIRIITQITAPDEGKVIFKGEPLAPIHHQQMGYLPEERGLYRKSKVGEQLMYLARLRGLKESEARKRIRAWLERLNLMEWAGRNLEDLSKGMQQKVQFIATVVHQPALIILDEPFSGFDPVNAALIRDEILELRRQGSTIIFSTHRMDTVEELCDYVGLINRSRKVLEGKKSDIKHAYKTHTFVIETDAPVTLTENGYEILQTESLEGGIYRHLVKIHQGSNNGLLRACMAQANIVSFHEQIPNMQEIFIRVVATANMQPPTV
ncbi:MAG: ABC transporter ATP-binding protein [Cytophagales bacterium]|nr:ABC transporter ATP-binding protein [Bernardetiaceae bacterium]MDW8204777.1 ABC transporter ATP-binding protein [Cytophagales bacterium]